MASLRDIKRRIRSVKNTQQITRAMKMVAAAKMRRSQDRILAARPYALELGKMIANLSDAYRARGDKLFEVRPEKKVLLVVVTGDRGLAGSFNATVLREAQLRLRGWPEAEVLLLGKKGVDFYRQRSTKVRASYPGLFADLTYAKTETIAQGLAKAYVEGEYDAIYVVFNEFRSILVQNLTVERLLPLGEVAEEGGTTQDYLFEPDRDAVLDELLPRVVNFQLHRALLESEASEHAARMTAMEAATKNAGELIEKLTLKYNRARQAAITTELIEVVSGATALEG